MDPNVTEHERSKAYRVCKTHLTGPWANIREDQLKVLKIRGGISNLLYYCSLPDDVNTEGEVPRVVLLRIYGPFYSDIETQLEIFQQLADENLGPKLYATFEDGRLEEYIDSSPLTWTQMTDDNVSALVARKIASIHKLSVRSLSENSSWLIDNLTQTANFVSKKCQETPPLNGSPLASTRDVADEMRSIKFDHHVNNLIDLLRDYKAPMVFSHNDLLQNNILLMHKKDLDPLQRIVLIDFEYCSYNFRTLDHANHLSEWCFDYTGDQYPNFTADLRWFPSEERQRLFLRNYLDQWKREGSSSSDQPTEVPDEEVEELFLEMQPLFMAMNLLWCLWSIKSAYTSKIDFGYWEMAKYKFEVYKLSRDNYTTLMASKTNGRSSSTRIGSKM